MSSEQQENNSSQQSKNDGFSRDQTLFLIVLMRQYISGEEGGLPGGEEGLPGGEEGLPGGEKTSLPGGEGTDLPGGEKTSLPGRERTGLGPPGTLQDLNTRLKRARPNKKLLWEEVSTRLGLHFQQSFCPVKVARKWSTLVEGYRRVKKDGRSRKCAGKRAMRFKFYTEMDNLLGLEQDVVFPVIVGGEDTLDLDASPRPAALKFPKPAPHKRRRMEEDVMEFLRQSELASQQRHDEMMAQLKSSQRCFDVLMTKLLNKL
ncbi:uncharacterized protein LOC133425414 isoform X2 [Cololabis saira]|nr:uncharacterized protein LOC133425414 isoform X2 [Cololabis saira]